MMPRDEQLKQSLLAAMLYHRADDLGLDRYSDSIGDHLDVVRGRPSGWSNLQQALEDFFLSRDSDLERPNHPDSSFLTDVAQLMAQIEEPQFIFRGDQTLKSTVVNVSGRLMRYEGWQIIQGDLAEWQHGVKSVPSNQADRGEIYRELLGRVWNYKWEPWPDVFQDEVEWAKALKFI
jgi:hypothetical protein